MHVMRLHLFGTQPRLRYAVHALVFDGKLAGEARIEAERFVENTIQEACASKELAKHRLWHSPWGFKHYSYDPASHRELDPVAGEKLRQMCYDMSRELGPKLLVAAMDVEPTNLCVDRLGCRFNIPFTKFAEKAVWNALHDIHVFWCCIPWLVILVSFPFFLTSYRKHKPFPRAKVSKEQ